MPKSGKKRRQPKGRSYSSICSRCGGSGSFQGKKCPRCGGQGWYEYHIRLPEGGQ